MRYCNWSTETPKFKRCRKPALDGGSFCQEHQIIKPPRAGELDRSGKEQVRDAYGGVCAVCGAEANEVDHIEPLSSFAPHERHRANRMSNLQLLCVTHHQEKSRQENRERYSGNAYDPMREMRNYGKSQRSRKKARNRANGIWTK